MRGAQEEDDAIEVAIQRASEDLDAFDLDAMQAKMAPPEEEAEEGMSAEECEACKQGACDNTDHLSEEDLAALME